jgi:hypothetical protein
LLKENEMPVNMSSRYTNAHVVVRTPTTFEEVNSMLDNDTELHVQNALLSRTRRCAGSAWLVVYLGLAVAVTVVAIVVLA